jgi:HAD superfamily hydrolase (TIGR01509 family)
MTNSIVFDMDGVLFDSERIYREAWRRSGRKLELTGIDECVIHCVGRNGSDIREYLLGRYGPSFPADGFIEDIKEEFNKLVDSDGLPLKDGVREILAWLADKGWKVALATSSARRSAERNLASSGLARYFQAVVTGDMTARGKPAPDIYLLACSRLGSAPEDCFAVEDSPNGVRSAHAAGLRVILVPDIIEPAAEIRRLAYKTFPSLVDVRAYLESFRNI